VKQSVAAEHVGELREMTKEPGRIEFPNLKVTFSETSAQSWRDWFEDFVVKGNSFRLVDATPGGADAIHRITAELYCERMQFVPGGGA
jgi:hypothetical protein